MKDDESKNVRNDLNPDPQFDRRQIIKGGLAAGASVLLAALETPSTAFAQAPKPGGKLRVAIPDIPITYDPCYFASITERRMTYLLYDTLTFLAPDRKLLPSLAKSWEPVDKGKAWVFHLNKDIKFHNGRELEAKDIAGYFNRVMDPKSGSANDKPLSPLENAVVIDKYTVRMNLSRPFADFPVSMSRDAACIIAPESAGRDTKKPIGTGPFKLKEVIPGEKVVFEKNPLYWRKGLPRLDLIEWVNIPDPSGQISALISGQVDLLTIVGMDYIDVLKKDKNVVLEEITSGTSQPVTMHMEDKPFDDPRVIYAMKNCIDREKFCDLVLRGHGSPANDVGVPPTDPFYHNIPLRKQNYKLAKELLTQAGYANGLDLTLYTSHVRPNMVASALTLKDMCEPVGIRIDVKIWPPDTYWKEVWPSKPFYMNNTMDRPTIHHRLYTFWHESGFDHAHPGTIKDVNNECHLINYTVSELLDMGMAELDVQKRLGIYKMAQAIIMEVGGQITAYTANYIRAKRKEVMDLPMDAATYWDSALCWKSS